MRKKKAREAKASLGPTFREKKRRFKKINQLEILGDFCLHKLNKINKQP